MEVHKFGGGTLYNAAQIRAMVALVHRHLQERGAVVVVSAIKGVTNMLEAALAEAMALPGAMKGQLETLTALHRSLLAQLLPTEHPVVDRIEGMLLDLSTLLQHLPQRPYDALYDLVVPYGELMSSLLVAGVLQTEGVPCQWVDIREPLRTNHQHRNAQIDQVVSTPLVREAFLHGGERLYVTQGFIASDDTGHTTTLGREGSDYSAAFLGTMLEAREVTIWKDVPGFLNADPQIFPHAYYLPRLHYRDAIELAACGAKIIHPKALQPLQRHDIPLLVKPFAQPDAAGSRIDGAPLSSQRKGENAPLPLMAVRAGQLLLSVAPKDLAFAGEGLYAQVFAILDARHMPVHMIQQSAVSLTLCVDYDPYQMPMVIAAIGQAGEVTYNRELVLFTVRYCTPMLRTLLDSFDFYILRQDTRHTVQLLLREHDWGTTLQPAIAAQWEQVCGRKPEA